MYRRGQPPAYISHGLTFLTWLVARSSCHRFGQQLDDSYLVSLLLFYSYSPVPPGARAVRDSHLRQLPFSHCECRALQLLRVFSDQLRCFGLGLRPYPLRVSEGKDSKKPLLLPNTFNASQNQSHHTLCTPPSKGLALDA